MWRAVTIDRPEVLNAVDVATERELDSDLERRSRPIATCASSC